MTLYKLWAMENVQTPSRPLAPENGNDSDAAGPLVRAMARTPGDHDRIGEQGGEEARCGQSWEGELTLKKQDCICSRGLGRWSKNWQTY